MMAKFPAIAGVAVAVAISLLTVGLPARLGLPVSVLGGVTVAMLAERFPARLTDRGRR